MGNQSLKAQSRTDYAEEKVSHEGVRTGSLQRIADAVEIIAKDKTDIEKQLKHYKDLAAERSQTIDAYYKEEIIFKRKVTRYKNQIALLKAEITELKTILNNNFNEKSES